MDDPASSIFALFQETQISDLPSVGTAVFDLLIIFFIVAMNAFFVASEFALVSSRRPRLQGMADAGSRGAAAALRLRDNPTLFISAV